MQTMPVASSVLQNCATKSSDLLPNLETKSINSTQRKSHGLGLHKTGNSTAVLHQADYNYFSNYEPMGARNPNSLLQTAKKPNIAPGYQALPQINLSLSEKYLSKKRAVSQMQMRPTPDTMAKVSMRR